MTNPRVFVVQEPATVDRTHGKFVRKYDLSPAKEFGRLVFVLGQGNIYLDRLEVVTAHTRSVLNDFTEKDFLLAIGDPVAIAMASMIASEKTGGTVNMLKWNPSDRAYRVFPISIRG